MIEPVFFLVLGLTLLLVGANLLVTSTERFSSAYSISGFAASFFIIGIATSAPEIFISIESALENETILAVGNSIGSNISNIALVFCLSVLFIKQKDKVMILPKNMFTGMILLTLSLFTLIIFDSLFNAFDALVLFLVFVVILFEGVYCWTSSRFYEDFEHSARFRFAEFRLCYFFASGKLICFSGHLI